MRRFSFLATIFLFASSGFADDIYTELWKLDREHNGMTPAVKGSALEEEADIVVDPQGAYDGDEGKKDKASNPLFSDVDEEKLTAPTFSALEALFDNYQFEEAEEEDKMGENAVEDREIDRFLDLSLETDVFKKALSNINTRKLTDKELSVADLKAEMKRMWFEPYTNYFRGSVDARPLGSDFAIGFEHVFVGEQGSSKGIGGYHNWYKFYLDEKAGKVDYLGHNLPEVKDAETVPDIATFAMKWDTPVGPAFKKVTGFLVGVSPELQLAWGTIAYFESAKYSDTEDKVIPVQLPGASLELVLYREMLRKPRNKKLVRGDQIRTFYPKLTSVAQTADARKPTNKKKRRGK